jgi:tetratricopeptide (TPR) repeat protein
VVVKSKLSSADRRGAVLAFNEGAAAMEAGDEEAAEEAWRRALQLDPSLAPAALNLATLYRNRDQLEAELEMWERIEAYDPFDTDHVVLHAAALRRAGRLREAVDQYKRAISIYPYYKFWYAELAAVYRELGQPEEAGLWEGRGSSLEADEAEICYEDGVRHAHDERWESARSCFVAVLEEFPANLDARLRLAHVLEQCAGADDVVGQLHRALELTDTAEGLVYFRLGTFYLGENDYEKALEAFRLAEQSVDSYLKASRAILETERRLAAHRAAEELPLLDPDLLGLEPIFDTGPPTLTPPNPNLPWHQQLDGLLEQVLALRSPDGSAPRAAVITEPDIELAPIVQGSLALLTGAESPLVSANRAPAVFVVEGSRDGQTDTTRSGWLGQAEAPPLKTGSWPLSRPGLALRDALLALRDRSGVEGFNCVILISFGRLKGGAVDLETPLAGVPMHCFCHLHPPYHYIDMRLAMSHLATNFIEISA